MKILYIHQYFTLPTGAGGNRSYYFAKKLIEQGHEVTMLCGGMEGAKTGGCSESLVSEVMVEGIRIIKINVPYSNKQSFMRRIMSFVKFVVVSLKIVLTKKYDFIYASSTPLTVGVLPLLAKLFRRKKYIFEVRDLWPDVPRALGIIQNKILLWLLNAFEKLIYKHAECCVGLSPGMVKGIQNKCPNKDIYLLPNACDVEFFSSVTKKTQYRFLKKKAGDFYVGFTGAHGIANGLDAVLDAARILKLHGESHIKFIFVGDGCCKKDLEERAEKEGLTNCVFLPVIPKTELKEVYSILDMGLMILKNNVAFQEGSSPNKFFDYISCSLPILVNYPGWMSRIISYYEIGVPVEPGSAIDFANKILSCSHDYDLMRHFSENTSLAMKRFDRNRISLLFVQILEDTFDKSKSIDIIHDSFDSLENKTTRL